MGGVIDWVCLSLAVFFVLQQLAKFAGVVVFFRRPPPSQAAPWAKVTLIQPVTRSENDLARVLQSRFRLDYPGPIQHILVCDSNDSKSQSICRSVLDEFPDLHADLVFAEASGAPVATKIEKMLAALPWVEGDILCFVDDDILLPPPALRILVAYLSRPGVGAVFGLASYTNWQNLWSSLMSSFVNSNALLNYIPLTYFTEPFTITGHCFAMSRSVFMATGGLQGMGNRVDDDHELARGVRRLGLKLVLTPLIYEVDNYLSSPHAYWAQMKRWFVIPRQSMLPGLTARETTLMMWTSADLWLPPVLALLALVFRRPWSIVEVAVCLAVVYIINDLCARLYTRHPTPWRWLLLPALSALAAPGLMLTAILGNNQIEWRGRRLRLQRGGKMESAE